MWFNYLEAAAQLEYKPLYVMTANGYDAQFAAWNKDGLGDNVFVRVSVIPLEQAASHPATKKYLDLVTENGGDVNLLGMQTTSSFLLWATAAKACGDDLTRACVLDELSKVHDWTAGGLHAPTDPGANKPGTCGMVLRLQGQKFEQWQPKKLGEFDCNPDFLVPVTGPLVDAAKLDADRISRKVG
jgi:hypothetical protein